MRAKLLVYAGIALTLIAITAKIAFSQIALASHNKEFKGSLTVTFGTSKTADTTLIAGALSTDKYQLTPTADPAGNLWAEAVAGTLIVHSDAAETGLTVNVLRHK